MGSPERTPFVSKVRIDWRDVCRALTVSADRRPIDDLMEVALFAGVVVLAILGSCL